MARKIKIKIKDSDSNTKINLPPIHFWLASGFINLAISTKSLWLNPDSDMDFFENINKKEIKSLFKELKYELKNYDAFDLVDISVDKGTEIKISIL